jgi:hypothetical protein
MFVQLGVKADTFTVRDFTRAIGDLPLAVAGAITSMTGLSIGFLEMTKHTLDLSNNLSLFRSETGLSTDELQRWQSVAKQVGLSGDVVTQSVLRISNAMSQMKLGHFDQGFMLAMGQLGVSAKGKNTFELLQAIMERSRTINPQIASAALANLGLSPELMKMPVPGSGRFNQMAQGGVVMSNRQIEAMQEFQAALAQFTLTIEKAFVPVVTAFEPYLKDVTEVMAAMIGTVGGWLGKGIGEDFKLLNMIRKEGLGTVMDNILNSYATPANMRDPKFVHYYMNNTQNIYSNSDPLAIADEAARLSKHEHVKAIKQFNNGGN